MSVIPGDIDADRGPPMTIPLRHFVVGLAFLVAGLVVATAVAIDRGAGLASLSHVHLLLAGWVCVTIMGAMTQFVPVWSGTTLHSRRLAAAELWLVAVGLAGFAAALLAGELAALHAFGGLMVLGFWLFAYNVGRTLLSARPWDVTERHFAIALAFFLAVTALGYLLALDFSADVLPAAGVSRGEVLAAHATLAVFGAVLTTVVGALYQLGTMFTQTELHGADVWVRRFEVVAYPAGVVALAVGRLLSAPLVASAGGALVALALLGFALVLSRKLVESSVERTPMLTRYWVVAATLAPWALLALPAWLADPIDRAVLFGAPGTTHLLVLGTIGFVVVGTLYHVVPFIVWVHRYSDLLGFEPVPMIDDLYDDRIAAADFALLLAGTAAIVAADLFELPTAVLAAGGALVLGGAVLFASNVVLVLRRHSPYPLPGVLFDRFASDGDEDGTPPEETSQLPVDGAD